ncbi:MAG: hypothetical protein RR593_08750 [Hungatella sp.]
MIVTSRNMSAKDALELYKSRDASEKLFKGDKSYLGNRSLRVQSDEAANTKIFAEFIALIIRSKMYTLLKDEVERLDKKPNSGGKIMARPRKEVSLKDEIAKQEE